MQRLFAITWLTWKAAFRFRLFLVLVVLLLGAVVGLPLLITKDDGTARGLTQILLTYTLTTITALLGLSTLWLACGTLARDVEECQIQLLAAKPIARWQIWVGKWLGIVTLDAALLAISGAGVYGLLMWRAAGLPQDQRAILRNEVMIARGSARMPSLEDEIQKRADELFRDRKNKQPELANDPGNLALVQRQSLETVKAEYQVVPPGYIRSWRIPVGKNRGFAADDPLYLRIKFNAAMPLGTEALSGCYFRVGGPNLARRPVDIGPLSLAPDTFHEFAVPAGLLDDEGMLTVSFRNMNDVVLVFPVEDGMEVLFREGGFSGNFARGLGIILCWMALLAAIGLGAASFLSFPVAAFLSLGVLTVVFSSGTLAGVVEAGSLVKASGGEAVPGGSAIDSVAVPFFRAVVSVINLAKDFSPIESLGTGRSIPWIQLGRAFAQIVLLLGGIISLIAIAIFNRRELATAQGNS